MVPLLALKVHFFPFFKSHSRAFYTGIMLLWLLSAPTYGDQGRTLMVLGDSLSAGYGIELDQGWVKLLEQKLRREEGFEVVNASVSGETTSGGLARLPALLKAHHPELVIIELGGNDGLRGQPTKGMQRNLTSMVALSRAAGAKVLLLGMRIPPNYGPRYTEAFFNVYAKVAEAEAVPLVPFFLEGVATNDQLMQKDGIHPKASAQPLMLENVWPLILGALQLQ